MAGNGEMDDKFVVFHKCMDRLPCGHYCQDTEINYLSGNPECSPCRKSKDYFFPCGHSIVIYCGAEKPSKDVCSKCEEISRSLPVELTGPQIDSPEEDNPVKREEITRLAEELAGLKIDEPENEETEDLDKDHGVSNVD